MVSVLCSHDVAGVPMKRRRAAVTDDVSDGGEGDWYVSLCVGHACA